MVDLNEGISLDVLIYRYNPNILIVTCKNLVDVDFAHLRLIFNCWFSMSCISDNNAFWWMMYILLPIATPF